MKVTLSRSESVPFRDENGDVIQMKQFEVGVTVEQGEGQTLEDLKGQMDLIFEEQKSKLFTSTPEYKRYTEKLKIVYNALKEINPTKAKEILSKIKK